MLAILYNSCVGKAQIDLLYNMRKQHSMLQTQSHSEHKSSEY